MTGSLPKLRSDLDLRPQATANGTALVIKDPLSGDFFRLQEAERFIAEQLDGVTPPEVVQSRVEEKFGAALRPEVLTGFIKTLERNGLLETEEGIKKRRRRGRIAGSLLYFRIRLFDPQRLFNRLIHRVGFFFTQQFVFLSTSVILAAILVAIFNWADIVEDASKLYRLSTLPLLIATIFVVMSCHEFAHGLTCKHFGGDVREMGFLLLYFQPAFYCNVSDAWLFPEKSKRLWVGFAGPYFELFLWGLATLAWRVTDTGTWINDVSLVVMATSGVKTLFNFNPLLKLDGYYLLSDYLEVPNLRKKSFRYLGDFLRGLGGLRGQLPEVTQREKRIFLTYGTIAWIASVSFLTYVGIAIGQQLVVTQQRVAFLAFTGLISLRLRSKFGRLFKRTSEKPESSRRSKRRFSFPKRLVVKLAVLGAFVLLLYAGRLELRIAGPINVLPMHNADVRTETEGIIEEIYASEGQRVSEGDLVARLSDRDQKAALETIDAQIQQVQAKIGMLEVGPTEQLIEVARRSVATAEDRVQFAQAKLTRDKSLFEQRLLAASEFDATRESEATAKNHLAEAQSRLQVLLEGTRPEEIEAARAELARLQAQQRLCKKQLELLNVLSPATGIITTPTRQLRAMVRQMIKKGDLLAKVHELNTVTVEAAISEKEIADVKVGQTVGIKTRAYPERVFYGKVTAIATTTLGSAAGSDPSAKSAPSSGSLVSADNSGEAVRVTTEIDNTAGLLKPGMTGMAKIYCGERRIIDLVTRRLSRTVRVEFWSWW